MVRWEEAVLRVETSDCVIAVLPFRDAFWVAADPRDQLTEHPSLAGLSRSTPERRTSVSGQCGAYCFSAGLGDPPRPIGGGTSWHFVEGGDFWIVCGLASEAPTELEWSDGMRAAASYDALSE